MQAESQQNRLVALRAQVREIEIPAQARVEAQLRTKVKDLPYLGLQDVARQTVLGNSQVHHAAGNRRGLKHRHGIAEQRQIVGGRKPRGAGAYDGYFLRMSDAGPLRKNV